MATVALYNMDGAKISSMEVSDAIFAAEVNKTVLHQVVVNYLANQRQGTQSTKTRTEVRGGGIKPWRKKGTGRARQGSTRAPQWIHGGIALGPKPRDYRISLNKKVKRVAIRSAISDKVAENKLIVVDAITATEYKTKAMAEMLKAIGAGKKALVVLNEKDDKVARSLANIPGVKTAYVNTINVYDILNADTFVVAQAAAKSIEEVYA